jgi:glycosyltransferase involved in cell wall biosynthesis
MLGNGSKRMKSESQKNITVAIDSQISAKASGGTETALLSLLLALGESKIRDRFVLLGLKGYDQELVPFMGANMEKFVWPASYRWYDPLAEKTVGMKPRWQKLQAALGPLGNIVPKIYRYYAHNTVLTPKVQRIARRVGPLRFMVAPAYRLYRGVRDEAARPMFVARADNILKARGVEAIHFPYPLHFETSLPYVYEPWGLPHHHQPECFRPGEAEWMDELFGKGCRHAAMVVTATRWVKQDIVSKYGIAPERIAVIPRMPRFDHAERFMDKATALAGLPESFALFPSATWITKNHIRLIRAIAKLRDEHGITLNLVCTGRTNTPESEQIKKEIALNKLENQVLFLGVVSVERLNTLYKSAKFLVHPSIFEGLGLPLLEAFHNGLPVLASTAACIPEVVGDAALLFDPFDETDIMLALLKAVQNPAMLDDLSIKGTRRIQHDFPGPDKIASMFYTVYRHAAKASLNVEQKALLDEMLT